MITGGYDQTWADTDDFKIMCFYARHASRFDIVC